MKLRLMVLALFGVTGCHHGFYRNRCQLFPTSEIVGRVGRLPPKYQDLSEAKPYRNYLGITHIEPAAHHFSVWYQDIEPTVVQLRARLDDKGRALLEYEGSAWGGLGVAPSEVPPQPPPEF